MNKTIFIDDNWEMVKLYLYHDFPQIFTCKHPNYSNQIYLANVLDMGRYFIQWILCPVNQETIQKLEEKRITLREAMLSEFDEKALLIKSIYGDFQEDVIHTKLISLLTENYLPEQHCYI